MNSESGLRVQWTRNDDGPEVVNSRTAEVLSVGNGHVPFCLEDGQQLELARILRRRMLHAERIVRGPGD